VKTTGTAGPLSAEAVRRAGQRLQAMLAHDERVRLVYLFGSAVRPGVTPPRDLDVAVLTVPPLSLEGLVRLRADLVAETAVPVDLVSLNDASIVLAHEIAEEGMCLFARTPDVEVDFVTRARARYWDFEPYREAQWRLAGERLAERSGGSPA
jgi:predicted nucleotidyltransferase